QMLVHFKFNHQTTKINFVSTEMRKLQHVTLDPDTAHTSLILPLDWKQVRLEDTPRDDPERFQYFACVMGEDGFTLGRFYYEVQVKGNTVWAVGVAYNSWNEDSALDPENGFWMLIQISEEYPTFVFLFVDYEEGQVSFYDVEDLYPYLCLNQNEDVKNSDPLTPGLKPQGANNSSVEFQWLGKTP
uniref:B30.2/SPRY domain-containing protein n=1 Tax=Esox lucius TaxID=8010 RepID=A0A6Q2YD37_ESOLU